MKTNSSPGPGKERGGREEGQERKEEAKEEEAKEEKEQEEKEQEEKEQKEEQAENGEYPADAGRQEAEQREEGSASGGATQEEGGCRAASSQQLPVPTQVRKGPTCKRNYPEGSHHPGKYYRGNHSHDGKEWALTVSRRVQQDRVGHLYVRAPTIDHNNASLDLALEPFSILYVT